MYQIRINKWKSKIMTRQELLEKIKVTDCLRNDTFHHENFMV